METVSSTYFTVKTFGSNGRRPGYRRRRISVVNVVDSLEMGGVSTVVLSQCPRLDPDRFSARILALSGESSGIPEGFPLDREPVEVREFKGEDSYSVEAYLKDAFLLGRIRVRGKEFLERIREIEPDILHFHTLPRRLGLGKLARQETGSGQRSPHPL